MMIINCNQLQLNEHMKLQQMCLHIINDNDSNERPPPSWSFRLLRVVSDNYSVCIISMIVMFVIITIIIIIISITIIIISSSSSSGSMISIIISIISSMIMIIIIMIIIIIRGMNGWQTPQLHTHTHTHILTLDWALACIRAAASTNVSFPSMHMSLKL